MRKIENQISGLQDDLNLQTAKKLGQQVALLDDAMDNNSGGFKNSKESIIANEDKIACEEGQGICAHALVVISVLLIFMTLPFSLCLSVKVVQVIHSWRKTTKNQKEKLSQQAT